MEQGHDGATAAEAWASQSNQLQSGQVQLDGGMGQGFQPFFNSDGFSWMNWNQYHQNSTLANNGSGSSQGTGQYFGCRTVAEKYRAEKGVQTDPDMVIEDGSFLNVKFRPHQIKGTEGVDGMIYIPKSILSDDRILRQQTLEIILPPTCATPIIQTDVLTDTHQTWMNGVLYDQTRVEAVYYRAKDDKDNGTVIRKQTVKTQWSEMEESRIGIRTKTKIKAPASLKVIFSDVITSRGRLMYVESAFKAMSRVSTAVCVCQARSDGRFIPEVFFLWTGFGVEGKKKFRRLTRHLYLAAPIDRATLRSTIIGHTLLHTSSQTDKVNLLDVDNKFVLNDDKTMEIMKMYGLVMTVDGVKTKRAAKFDYFLEWPWTPRYRRKWDNNWVMYITPDLSLKHHNALAFALNATTKQRALSKTRKRTRTRSGDQGHGQHSGMKCVTGRVSRDRRAKREAKLRVAKGVPDSSDTDDDLDSETPEQTVGDAFEEYDFCKQRDDLLDITLEDLRARHSIMRERVSGERRGDDKSLLQFTMP